MAFNGSGVFQRLYNWVTDRGNGIKIRADRMDAEMDGIATGLSNCITKDGQTTVTADIPLATHKLTGMSAGSGAGHSVRWEQVLGTTLTPSQITSNQNDYAPSNLATAAILRLDTDAARTITGISATVGRNELTLVNIGSYIITLSTADTGSAAANRFSFGANYPLFPGQSVTIVYDSVSTAWRHQSPSGNPTVITTIASGSLPSAAVLDITGIPATYRALQLVLLGASSDTATRKVQLRISTDNGSTFLATGYAGYVDDGTNNVSMALVLAQVATAVTAATTQDIVFKITDYQGGLYPQCQFSGINSSGLAFSGNGSYKGGTTAVNALRVLWDGSGNFDAGTYILYGIR